MVPLNTLSSSALRSEERAIVWTLNPAVDLNIIYYIQYELHEL